MTAKVGQCLQKAIEIMFPKNFCADPCARALASPPSPPTSTTTATTMTKSVSIGLAVNDKADDALARRVATRPEMVQVGHASDDLD